LTPARHFQEGAMLVFPDARIVLLAVPKTGSTALELAFGPHAGVVLRQPPTLSAGCGNPSAVSRCASDARRHYAARRE
jgi:hypothetical protein